MFSGFKKTMAEAREAEDAKSRVFSRIFQYRPDSGVWEYCSVSRVQDTSSDDMHVLGLIYVDSSGAEVMRYLEKDENGKFMTLHRTAELLGRAGWECFNVTKTVNLLDDSNRKFKGQDRPVIMEEELFFKRRLSRSNGDQPETGHT